MQENNLTQSYESDTNWDESSLAQLLGFHDESQLKNSIYSAEPTSTNSDVTENASNEFTHNTIAIHELFDDPQTGKTRNSSGG